MSIDDNPVERWNVVVDALTFLGASPNRPVTEDTC